MIYQMKITFNFSRRIPVMLGYLNDTFMHIFFSPCEEKSVIIRRSKRFKWQQSVQNWNYGEWIAFQKVN